MKGLELARRYYGAQGKPMIEAKFAAYADQIAAGLVGEGSECLGFDDELSQDHDFGPGFCLWIPEALWCEIGASLQEAYDDLPKSFLGYRRMETPQAKGRVGVMTIESFYQRFTGLESGPEDNLQWFRIPEHFLATATNGEVFFDPLGRFTEIRRGLQGFYPEDVVKKKLAARAVIMAQSGQYNYPRSMRRGQYGAAYLACAEFVRTALSAIYLLNGVYIPFYKWAFRGAGKLTVLRDSVSDLSMLASISDTAENREKKEALIEQICVAVGGELRNRGWSDAKDDFLQAHGDALMRNIGDPRLASMHIMADG